MREVRGPAAGLRTVIRSLVLLASPERRASGTVRVLQEADVVVGKGGHVFVTRRGLRGLMSLWLTTFPLVLATRMGIPAVTGPTSIGPFENGGSRFLNRWILRRLDAVVARDELSAGEARQVGVPPEHVHSMPDTVFAMPDPTAEAVDDLARQLELSGSYAVLVVRAQGIDQGREAIFRAFVRAGTAMVQDAAIRTLLIVPQVRGDDDEAMAARLAAELEGTARLIDDLLDPGQLIALYGGARVVVTCRLHAAIFASIAGTPAIAVSIDGKKTEGVYRSLDLPPSWVVRLSEIDGDALTLRCREVLAGDEGSQRTQIRQSTHDVREQLSAYGELLRAVTPAVPRDSSKSA